VPDIKPAIRRIDHFQQEHALVGFPYAVQKKFGDDQGGHLCALITYYGFLSLFPLLLVLTTVLSYVLKNNPDLQHDILNSALADFPVIGADIKKNVGTIHGSGLGLLIGIIGTFWGGLGVANAAQDAMNRVWEVPMRVRPGFLPRILRSLGLVAMLGIGILITTVLSAIAGGASGLAMEVRIATLVLGFVLNVLLFSVAYRVLTAAKLRWSDVVVGAIVAAFGWAVLQVLGGAFVSHQLEGMGQTYGLFALVLGLLAWIFLQARIVMYAAEVNVVRARRLWPRSMDEPLTDADKRAEKAYQQREVRRLDTTSAPLHAAVSAPPSDAAERDATADRSQRDEETAAGA
jgi:YihY family inner membrane protein